MKSVEDLAREIHNECFIDVSQSERPKLQWDIDLASALIRADREEVIDAVEARLLGKDGHYLDTHQTFSREDIEVALNVFKAEIGGEV